MSTFSEHEAFLRRALHSAADSLEPGHDGLERIQARLQRPHPMPLAWAEAAWTGLAMGIGTMLTSSVSVVQSSFPDRDQGDISGLSRSFSNLGSSLGTALVGPVLVAAKLPAGPAIRRCPDHDSRIALIGVLSAMLIPRQPGQTSHEMTNSRC